MTAMTIGTPGPLLPLLREWTVADLESLPDDGLQYEKTVEVSGDETATLQQPFPIRITPCELLIP